MKKAKTDARRDPHGEDTVIRRVASQRESRLFFGVAELHGRLRS